MTGTRTGPAPRVVAVVQARAGSTRLPGKVLAPLGDRLVLDWVVSAATAATGVDDVVVATTREAEDDAVAERAAALGASCVRGDVEDVLSRFVLAARLMSADAVVRLTGDCPLLDPRLIGDVVAAWRRDRRLEYVATTLVRTLPRGLDVELISRTALDACDAEATGVHRTHVTSLLYATGRATDALGLVTAPTADDLRVTLDEPDDLVLLREIVARLGEGASDRRRLVDLLRREPALVRLNAHVEQKPLSAG